MNPKIYNEKDLPWAELVKLGLAAKGKLLMSQTDQEALLSGRRSSLLKLSNIAEGSFHIGEIDLKLSLKPDEKGRLQLQAHPINRYPETPIGLEEHEANQLISGEKMLIYKKLKDAKSEPYEAIFEYDPETREFVKTDPQKIIVPEKVNSEQLTLEQREDYRQGKEVKLAEGTNFRYTGVDPDPIRSERLLIIASILVDGGLTYLAFQGIKTLAGFINKNPKAAIETEGYLAAKKEMELHNPQSQAIKPASEQDRSYTRSGRSR